MDDSEALLGENTASLVPPRALGAAQVHDLPAIAGGKVRPFSGILCLQGSVCGGFLHQRQYLCSLLLVAIALPQQAHQVIYMFLYPLLWLAQGSAGLPYAGSLDS